MRIGNAGAAGRCEASRGRRDASCLRAVTITQN